MTVAELIDKLADIPLTYVVAIRDGDQLREPIPDAMSLSVAVSDHALDGEGIVTL